MTTLSGRLLRDGWLLPGRITFEGVRIVAVEHDPSVVEERIVAPGFIDLQVNGGHGIDFGEEPERMAEVAAWLPETGCTSFLPTIISSFADRYRRVFDTLPAIEGGDGARVLGLHLEGPFLAAEKKGAHALEAIEAADDALFDELLGEDAVRLVTLAPERTGALQRIARLVERGVLVSLGHTNATYEQFEAGIDAGARMATHLFNAMSQLDSRAPGAAGAALVDERVTVGLIADGIHTHLATLALTARAKGTGGIALVSDMMAAAGMPPGRSSLNDIPVVVDETSARLADGRLAGSILTMDAAVRNMATWSGVSIADALTMATAVPARLLGRSDLGRLEAGALADLVILDPDLTVAETWIAGERVFPTVDPPTRASL
jgi:N-acetylglucosamine-6-phosphate deacetylase